MLTLSTDWRLVEKGVLFLVGCRRKFLDRLREFNPPNNFGGSVLCALKVTVFLPCFSKNPFGVLGAQRRWAGGEITKPL